MIGTINADVGLSGDKKSRIFFLETKSNENTFKETVVYLHLVIYNRKFYIGIQI